MKLIHTFMVLVFLGFILSGCISLTEPTVQPQGPEVKPECRTVVMHEPYPIEECLNASKMEEFCAIRELNYSFSDVTKTWLCSEENLCVAYNPDGSCAKFFCSKGMTRCRITLTNLDDQKIGTWSVAANFSLDGIVFDKNPSTKIILPKESAVFNFEQFYRMDMNQKKAECEIYVTEPAKVQDCNFITKVFEECKNITQYKEITKQVCD